MVCNTCLSTKPIGDIRECPKCGIMVCQHDHPYHRCIKAGKEAPAKKKETTHAG